MSHVKSHSREPLLRIAKREGISRPKAYGVRAAAVLLSLVVSGIFIFTVTKLNPIAVYEGIYDGAFGTPRRFWATIRDTMMLLCIGVGLAPAFKMRFWNIGADSHWRRHYRRIHAVLRRYNSHPRPTGLDGRRLPDGRRCLGCDSRHLQGPLEH